MLKKYLLVILLLFIIGCSNGDDEDYVIYREMSYQELFELIEMGNYTSDNCYINESGDEICVYRIESGKDG